MRRNTLATIFLMGLAVPASAQEPSVAAAAESEAPVSRGIGPATSGTNGTLGVHRVETARSMGAGELVLTIGGEYFVANDFIAEGDQNTRQVQRITVAWAPIENLELLFSQQSLTNNNNAFEPGTIQILGDPTVGFKVPYLVMDNLGVGLAVQVLVPTSPQGEGLKPEAYRLSAVAMASYALSPMLELSFNAGYLIDNTSKLFKRDIERVQQFTAGISRVNQIYAGLGVGSHFVVADAVGIGPFAEFTANIGEGARMPHNPMRATIGSKFYPAKRSLMELTVGADYAVSGPPRAKGDFPGIPPWEVFGRVTAHLSASSAPVNIGGPTTCSAEPDCATGESCVDGLCRMIQEVEKIVEKEVIKEVVKDAPTFFVAGAVFDDTSGEPIASATISLSGADYSALAVDPKTGKFKSYGLATGDGLVQIKAEAPGYRPNESTIPKGALNEVKQITLKLQSLGKDAVGELKGSLKDGRTGKPVKGQIFVPVLNKKVKSDGKGVFRATLKAGRYQVLISAPRYMTQKKEIDIRPGDVVILNLDLSSKRR